MKRKDLIKGWPHFIIFWTFFFLWTFGFSVYNFVFFSTWTIDLCYLLHRFGIRHIYTTITVGVNPEFRSHDYYGPILWKDHIRVSNKFDTAACDGLSIQKRTVDNRLLLDHLAKNGPIIALTNGELLHCDLCSSACRSKGAECLGEIRWESFLSLILGDVFFFFGNFMFLILIFFWRKKKIGGKFGDFLVNLCQIFGVSLAFSVNFGVANLFST